MCQICLQYEADNPARLEATQPGAELIDGDSRDWIERTQFFDQGGTLLWASYVDDFA